MKIRQSVVGVIIGAIFLALQIANVQADIVRTTFNGLAAGADQSAVPADAELREEGVGGANAMRGDNQELASRRGTTQNSVMLMRFDVSGITAGDLAANPFVTLRLHVDTTSWTRARSKSVPDDPTMGTQFGLEYYGLNTSAAGQNWNEANVAFNTAPGLTFDADVTTKGYNPATTTSLGTKDFVPIHISNNLPVGHAWDFSSAALKNFVRNAILGGSQFVTLMAGVNQGEAGYNYIFASNDDTALLSQTNFDPDGGGPLGNTTSANSASPNTNGRWAPTLILSTVPEPSSLVLLVLSGLAGGAFARRRQ